MDSFTVLCKNFVSFQLMNYYDKFPPDEEILSVIIFFDNAV